MCTSSFTLPTNGQDTPLHVSSRCHRGNTNVKSHVNVTYIQKQYLPAPSKFLPTPPASSGCGDDLRWWRIAIGHPTFAGSHSYEKEGARCEAARLTIELHLLCTECSSPGDLAGQTEIPRCQAYSRYEPHQSDVLEIFEPREGELLLSFPLLLLVTPSACRGSLRLRGHYTIDSNILQHYPTLCSVFARLLTLSFALWSI